MRAEEKEVDGPDLEREERLAGSELEEQDEEELPELQLDEQRELARLESGALLSAVQAILARQHVIVETLPLREHELRALGSLQAAVEGRDAKLHQFVYASDRRDLLEQALAVLQPNLAYDEPMYASLVQHVGELRHSLTVLEDSQDDLLVVREREKLAKTGDAGDAPKDDTGTGDVDAAEKPTTLTGPEVKEPAKPPTSLTGPEVKEPAKPPTSLTGPEEKEAPKPPTSLGDPEDLAAAEAEAAPVRAAPGEAAAGGGADPGKKKPWWKRPFG